LVNWLGGPLGAQDVDQMRAHPVPEGVGEAAQAHQVAFVHDHAPERLVRVGPAWVGAFDDTAEVPLEHAGGAVDDVAHLRVDRGVAEVGAVGDAQAAQVPVDGVQPVDVVGGDAQPVPVVVAGDNRKHECGVGDRAGERADMFQGLPAGHAGIPLVLGPGVQRHPAHGRLDAVDAAEAGRDADRATAVTAQ